MKTLKMKSSLSSSLSNDDLLKLLIYLYHSSCPSRNACFIISYNTIISLFLSYPFHNAPVVFWLDCDLAVVVVPAMPLYAEMKFLKKVLALLRFFIDVLLSDILHILLAREAKEVSYLLA